MLRQDSGKDALSRAEWVVSLLATAAAIALSIWFARHAGALFRDEVNSLNVAGAPSLAELWRLLEFESSPALWLLLLRAWLAGFGAASDVGLRVFGLLGALALPAALWFAAVRLGRTVPLVGLALVAVNPEVLRWTASLRAWGLGTALAVVALVLVREAAREPSRRRVLLAALSAVLSVHCAYQNSVLLAASAAGAVAVACSERRWRRAAVPLGVGAIAALSLLIYVPTLRRVSAWSMLNQGNFRLGHYVGRAVDAFAASGEFVLACWLVVALAALAASAWAWSSAEGRRNHGDVPLFASATGVAAVVGFALFLLRVRYLTNPWYYIGLMALVAVCADAALAASLRSRGWRAARVALASLVLLVGIPGAARDLRLPQTNADVVASHLRRHAASSDLVVVNPWFLAISLGRYYLGDAEVTTIPPLEDLRVHRFDLLKRQMESGGAQMEALRERAGRVLQAGGRVWVVGLIKVPTGTEAPATPPPPPLPETGWNPGPYTSAWTQQLGAFLAAHATEAKPLLGAEGDAREVASLSVIRGWRRADPPRTSRP